MAQLGKKYVNFSLLNAPIVGNLWASSLSVKEYTPKITISQNGMFISSSPNSFIKISGGGIDITFPKVKFDNIVMTNKIFFNGFSGPHLYSPSEDTIGISKDVSIERYLSVGNKGYIFPGTFTVYPNIDDISSVVVYTQGSILPSFVVSADSGSSTRTVRVGIGTPAGINAVCHISGSLTDEKLLFVENKAGTDILTVSSSGEILLGGNVTASLGILSVGNITTQGGLTASLGILSVGNITTQGGLTASSGISAGGRITTNASITASGNISASGTVYCAALDTNNGTAIVGAITINDPGPNEGLIFNGGNWRFYESPNDLATNAKGNLQFVSGSTIRKVTFDESGIDVVGNLTASGNITAAGKLGIGTVTVPHAATGWAKIAIEGADSTLNGPHVQFTTAADNYPLLSVWPYSHDAVAILFDMYYEGDWYSSDVGSNFMFYKGATDQFTLYCNTGTTAGSTFTNKIAWQFTPGSTALAGLFSVPGTGSFGFGSFDFVEKSGGSFKIDHPLDPENKYLHHSFVESPDMMNIYNGNVILDENGEAKIQLPLYFESLNMDFRYQLTSIGSYETVFVSEEIKNNWFKISGGNPMSKISWQVTGIRHDDWANKYRIQVESDKIKENKH